MPGVDLTSIANNFTLGFSGSGSTEATRVGIVHFFFPVAQLIEKEKVLREHNSSGTTCIPSKPAPGFLYIESDLKLKEWLFAAAAIDFNSIAGFPSDTSGPLGQDTISHEVRFQVVTTAGINPLWKLVDLSTNTGSALLSGSRDRFQDLLITLGPLDVGKDGRPYLSSAAAALDQAQQFGIAVNARALSGIRSTAPLF